MSTRAPAVLVETTRRDVRSGRGVVESRHRGHLVVVAPDGEVAARAGDPDRVTFVRSAAKPFQAAACLELAGVEPSDEEVAVAWASHRAEPEQRAAVVALLERSGSSPDDLTCPAAVPQDDPAATPHPLHHNCSGKHALFALAGAAVGCPPSRLLDPDGPLQRRVLGVVTGALGPAAALAVDGCGAPAPAVALTALARAFAALAEGGRWARVRDAGLARPGLVGGRGRLESALLARGIVAKPGAEGVFAAAVAAEGGMWGIALKVEDGAPRAAAAALHGLLVSAGVVPASAWTPPAVLGGGQPVGEVRPAAAVAGVARGVGAAFAALPGGE